MNRKALIRKLMLCQNFFFIAGPKTCRALLRSQFQSLILL
jgi:hypothetical protein